MTRSTTLTIVLSIALSVLTATSARAQQPLSSRPGWMAGRSNPYSRLFIPKGQPLKVAPALVQPKPIVKCGMTIIPGDPTIDPGILKPLPKDSTRYTIRVVEPTMCR